jgi:GNAT superfamily N-acetyltransferase
MLDPEPASTPPVVRLATGEDRRHLIALIQAGDRHYHSERPAPDDDAVAAMLDRIAAEPAFGTRFAVALHEGEPAGFAAFAIIHPGVDLKGLLFLKDLMVMAAFRNVGIGEALMRFLARFALEKGIGRIDLTTELGNLGARRFYERLAMRPLPKVFLRLDGADLARLAQDGALADDE